jgi:hypothetical protein
VVRVPGYRSKGPDSIPGATGFSEKQWERGSLSLMSTIEELLERKSSGSCLENQHYGLAAPVPEIMDGFICTQTNLRGATTIEVI